MKRGKIKVDVLDEGNLESFGASDAEAELKLALILARDAGGAFQLWACRGEGRGCPRNKYRAAKKPCDDCAGPLATNWTVRQVAEHMKRGDA